MKLYHYSDKIHNPILTRARQLTIFKDEYKKSLNKVKENYYPGSYYDHVSFFLEPIPFKEIGNIFAGTDHRVWVNGKQLFEHVVEVGNLPDDMIYHIVESLSLQKFWEEKNLNSFSSEKVWNKAFLDAKELQIKNGEWGDTKTGLIKIGNQERIELIDFYRRSKESPNWQGNQKKYAADVPHVMIYSKIGAFVVSEINVVTIGERYRKKLSLTNLYEVK